MLKCWKLKQDNVIRQHNPKNQEQIVIQNVDTFCTYNEDVINLSEHLHFVTWATVFIYTIIDFRLNIEILFENLSWWALHKTEICWACKYPYYRHV